MARQAAPVARAVAFRLTGLARMPGGEVSVDSVNRPMVMSRIAEK
jgi:hypothetical protein